MDNGILAGHVLVKVNPLRADDFKEKFGDLQSRVKGLAAFPVEGDWNYVLTVCADPMEFGKIVVTNIRTLPGVYETKTLACESHSNSDLAYTHT